jgi:hypothetical protein
LSSSRKIVEHAFFLRSLNFLFNELIQKIHGPIIIRP